MYLTHILAHTNLKVINIYKKKNYKKKLINKYSGNFSSKKKKQLLLKAATSHINLKRENLYNKKKK